MLITIESDSARRLRVDFRINEPRPIRAELEVNLVTMGPGERALSEISRMIDNARHSTERSHCAECDWHQIMAIVRHCHTILARSTGAEVEFKMYYETPAERAMTAVANQATLQIC